MTKKIINCESDCYVFHGDTIKRAIEKLENIARLYGDSAVISCCEVVSFLYSREEKDEEYVARLRGEALNLERERVCYEGFKR